LGETGNPSEITRHGKGGIVNSANRVPSQDKRLGLREPEAVQFQARKAA